MRRTQACLALLLAAPLALALDAANRNLKMVPGPYNNDTAMQKYFSVMFAGLFGPDGTKSSAMPLKNEPGKTPAAMTTLFGAENLPQLVANSDYAKVTVKRLDIAPPAGAADITVYACYAKASLYDRGWRKPSNDTELDKQCPWFIGSFPADGDKPATGGNLTWNINPDTPKAIMFLRAYQMCKPPADSGSDEEYVCAFGNSPGVIQVNPIETHPTNLIAGAIICILLGPLCLVGFYVYESRFKKWH